MSISSLLCCFRPTLTADLDKTKETPEPPTRKPSLRVRCDSLDSGAYDCTTRPSLSTNPDTPQAECDLQTRFDQLVQAVTSAVREGQASLNAQAALEADLDTGTPRTGHLVSGSCARLLLIAQKAVQKAEKDLTEFLEKHPQFKRPAQEPNNDLPILL